MKNSALENEVPVDAILPELQTSLGLNVPVVLKASPGAGKTTRIPPSLLSQDWLKGKKILMLEPRRLAARNAAVFMASQSGTELGKTFGYRIRQESCCFASTKVEVVTEAILIQMLLNDPELTEIGCVIFDEFHERNISSDLGLGMVIELRRHFRCDLRLLVMSATLSLQGLQKLMPEAKVLECEGRQFPLEIEYHAGPEDKPDLDQVAEMIRKTLKTTTGNVLVFLPGVGEITRLMKQLESLSSVELCALHGQMKFEDQRKVLQHSLLRRVTLATDIAESSLTLPEIRVVIDTGFCRSPEYDSLTQINRLKTRRCSLDSVDQRAGRAGRTGPGTVIRLWSLPRHRMLKPERDPEILQGDLERTLLELASWGSRCAEFPWLTPPQEGMWQLCERNLEKSAAIKQGDLLPFGRELLSMPLSPRLGRILLMGKNLGEVSLAALLVTWWQSPDALSAGEIDLELRLRHYGENLKRSSARDWQDCLSLCQHLGASWSWPDFSKLGSLLVKACPERLAKKRANDRRRYLLSVGFGAELPEAAKALHNSPWLICPLCRQTQNDAVITVALLISEQELLSIPGLEHHSSEELTYDEAKDSVKCEKVQRILGLEWQRSPLSLPNDGRCAVVLIDAIRAKGLKVLPWGLASKFLLRYAFLKKIEPEIQDLSETFLLDHLELWLATPISKARKLSDISEADVARGLRDFLDISVFQKLEKIFPENIKVPSGSICSIDYSNGQYPVLSVRIQEVFGWKKIPPLGSGQRPLSLALLSPAYRPIQMTADLESFWLNTYPEVKRELQRKYPKHSWPENPREALAVKGAIKKAKTL